MAHHLKKERPCDSRIVNWFLKIALRVNERTCLRGTERTDCALPITQRRPNRSFMARMASANASVMVLAMTTGQASSTRP